MVFEKDNLILLFDLMIFLTKRSQSWLKAAQKSEVLSLKYECLSIFIFNLMHFGSP
jgi:hypothetical protein